MMIIKDSKKVYYDELLKHLRAHNQLFAGKSLFGKRYFYVVEDNKLIGAIRTSKSWDWVTIGDLYFQDIEVLKFMLMKISIYYKGTITGIKSFTTVKNRNEELLTAGFHAEATLKGTPLIPDCKYMTNRALDFQSSNVYEWMESEEPIESYKDEWKNHIDRFEKENNIVEESEFISYVAVEKDEFLGGVVGYLNQDSLYIDLLAVKKEHRGRNIGSKLMQEIEEYAKEKNVYSINLGTAEFQAREFYEKLGYVVIMTLEDYPKGYTCHTMLKKIKAH